MKGRTKPEAGSSMWVSHMGIRVSTARTMLSCLPRCLSRKLDLNQRGWFSNWHCSVAGENCKGQLNSWCHGIVPQVVSQRLHQMPYPDIQVLLPLCNTGFRDGDGTLLQKTKRIHWTQFWKENDSRASSPDLWFETVCTVLSGINVVLKR